MASRPAGRHIPTVSLRQLPRTIVLLTLLVLLAQCAGPGSAAGSRGSTRSKPSSDFLSEWETGQKRTAPSASLRSARLREQKTKSQTERRKPRTQKAAGTAEPAGGHETAVAAVGSAGKVDQRVVQSLFSQGLETDQPLSHSEVGKSVATRGAGGGGESLVLIGTADGSLHAINTVTGKLHWQIPGGPLLTTSHGKGDYVLLPDLSDGTLYYTDPRSNEVRRLSKTVQQLAGGSAVLAADGNMYIGQKKSTVYVVDYKTGTLRGQFLSGELSTKGALLIGRNEYTLVVQSPTGEIVWNMTFAEYTSPMTGIGTVEPTTPDGEGIFEIEPDPSGTGSIMRCVAIDGGGSSDNEDPADVATRWEQRFGYRAVSMYGASPRGGFQRLPLRLGGGRLGGGGTELIDVLKTQTGQLYVASAGHAEPPDADSSLSVYNPDWNEWQEQVAVGRDVMIVGPQPDALPFVVGGDSPGLIDPTTVPPPSPPPLDYTQIALTVVVTGVVTAVGVWWVLWTSRPPIQLPPLESPLSSQNSILSAGLSSSHSARSVGESDGTGADDGGSGSGVVATSGLREVPIADGEAGSIRLGKIDVFLNRLLGRGSLGTLVYKGRYDGHDIAVKRMLKDYYELAMHEVDLLLRSDDHPNVIRYFAKEEGAEFLYIGLELCVGTLVHVVDGPDAVTGPTPDDGGLTIDLVSSLDRKRLAREMLSGLLHLHNLQVVHRDLKPQNVLLTHRLVAVISDFGLCKALHEGQSSFHHTENVGTQGWVAPEVLKKNVGRITRAIDVFAAGCVLHYLFSRKHPFGEYYEREKNIRQRKVDICTEDPLISSLVQHMVRQKPDRRISTKRALAHPFFWPLSKRLTFLMDASDRLEAEPEGSPLLERFEQDAEKAIGGPDWSARVGEEFRQDLRRFRTYHGDRLVDLLRAIRNKRHHYGELPPELKKVLGSVPDGYMSYFHERFPQLLLHVYRFVTTTDCLDEPLFAPYFEV